MQVRARTGKTKNYKFDICCFSAKYTKYTKYTNYTKYTKYTKYTAIKRKNGDQFGHFVKSLSSKHWSRMLAKPGTANWRVAGTSGVTN